jgi:methyl-accepting chemotaxis protein
MPRAPLNRYLLGTWLRFKYRIWALVLNSIVIVFVGLAINARTTASASASLEAAEQVQYPLVEALRSLRADHSAIGEALRQSLAAGDRSGLEGARDRYIQAQHDLDSIAALGPAQQGLATQLREQFQSYYIAASEATEQMLNKNNGGTSAAVETMQDQNLRLQHALSDHDNEARTEFQRLLASSAQGVNSTLHVSVIVALFSTAALMMGAGVLISGIFRTLGGEPERAAQVVRRLSGGDFSERIALARDGDDSLLFDIASLQQQLGRLIGDIRGSSRYVHAASTEMDDAVKELSERTANQASSLEETASSMEELTTTVRQNADSARNASEFVLQARERAQSGGEVVNRAVGAMSHITSSSMRIADIIGVIDEIAFQTNLLALNAAVEAARAGDNGRGFAVVAQEVRLLAQRSATAAREIKQLIQGSVEQVQQGSQLVNETGKHLHAIVESIAQVATIVSDIAGASQEQARGLSEINTAVAHVDSMTQRNALVVEQVNTVARNVAEQAQHLTRFVEGFVIEERLASTAPATTAAPADAPSRAPPSVHTTGSDPVERRPRRVA